MKAFVTVGTTRFDELICRIFQPDCLETLKRIGITSLLVQSGNSDLTNVENEYFDGKSEAEGTFISNGINICYYKYKGDILQDIKTADLVIGHAGAGTILDVLRNRKPLMVVINEKLMGNHQTELADALAEGGHVLVCTPRTLSESLLNRTLFELTPYNPPDQNNVVRYINNLMGVTKD